jgi:hypothetical protein
MIQGCLVEVKIDSKTWWWFSTSQSGGFRPGAGISEIERGQEK